MNHKIAVIGLGYVGLPLARLFAEKYPVVGFDINQKRVEDLQNGHDDTLEVSDELLQSVLLKANPQIRESTNPQLRESATEQISKSANPRIHESATEQISELANQRISESANPQTGESANPQISVTSSHVEKPHTGLYCSSSIEDIKDANVYIITVPTPVDKNNRPVLTPLIKASETVGKVIKKGDIVIYESTVYPGATEEDCIPVVEKTSGLKYNVDFFAGYSPERINPGDKEHRVEKILKVTSGSTPEIGKIVDDIYNSVITAGTHLAPTIKVAEAAKVIENSQRDINIAFVNELAKIFNLMEIDTHAVLEAAGTKWNFLPFKPGLVGGHCIGVDPYYLAQKAQEYGYHPEIILAGRRLNDSMGKYVAEQVVKAMIKKNINVNGAEVLMLGVTFKENCPDVRNTKIVDVIAALEDYGMKVTTYDPWANPEEVKHEYGLNCVNSLDEEASQQIRKSANPQIHKSANEPIRKSANPRMSKSANPQIRKEYDAIVLGVAHKEFLDLDLSLYRKENSVVYDVKGILTSLGTIKL